MKATRWRIETFYGLKIVTDCDHLVPSLWGLPLSEIRVYYMNTFVPLPANSNVDQLVEYLLSWRDSWEKANEQD